MSIRKINSPPFFLPLIKKRACVLFFFLSPSLLFAQQDTTHTAARFYKSYFKSYLTDTKDIVVAPFHWNSKQWLATAVITGAGAILYTQDLAIHDVFQKNRNTDVDNISKYGLEPWGSGKYSMGTMALFYLYGVAAKNERSQRVALLGVKTYLITGLLVNVSKELIHRHRPYQAEGEALANNTKISPYTFGDYSSTAYTSLPSGHTVSIFAVATIVATEYKDKIAVPIAAYTIAGLTGLSRINDNKHWASDVFLGAAFGYGMAKLIYNKNNWGITIAPYSDSQHTGLLMQIPVK